MSDEYVPNVINTEWVRESYALYNRYEGAPLCDFDAWFAAELAKKEAEVRADEREKAEQRVLRQIALERCDGDDNGQFDEEELAFISAFTLDDCEPYEYACVCAARGEEPNE